MSHTKYIVDLGDTIFSHMEIKYMYIRALKNAIVTSNKQQRIFLI